MRFHSELTGRCFRRIMGFCSPEEEVTLPEYEAAMACIKLNVHKMADLVNSWRTTLMPDTMERLIDRML